jgi:hypothetical protein
MAANKSESNHPFNQVWRRNCIIFVTEVNEHGPPVMGFFSKDLFMSPCTVPWVVMETNYGQSGLIKVRTDRIE